MPSFQPFSSGGQSSHLHTPETTPLRKRENDSFASPEAPLLWRQPLQPATGGLHGSTYSPSMAASSSHFAELNFPHNTRRRGRHSNRHGAQFWVPWVMKGILASPLVVIMLWLMVVTLHHPKENNRYGGAHATIPRNMLQQKQGKEHPILHPFLSTQKHPEPDKILPVYVPLGSSGGGSQNEQPQPQIFPLLAQSNGVQTPQLMMPQSGMQEQGLMQASHYQPMRMTNGGQQEYAQAQPQMMMPMQQANNMMVGQNMMQLTQQQPGQMYQQIQPNYMMQQQGQPQMQQNAMMQPQMMQAQPQMQSNNMMMQQAQPQMMNQNQQMMMQQQQQTENQPIMMNARGNHAQNQRPVHPSHLRGGGKKNVKSTKQQAVSQPAVFYYDPAQAVVNGQLQAPSVVYDEHGNEIELASLVAGATELMMEAPLMAETPLLGSSQTGNGNRRMLVLSNSTSISNSTGPLGPLHGPLPPPALEMKIKTPDSWGTNTAQDQGIIVCTVAVMALLVGALSARRLRARSFLSSCIENESLEDEVAFDSAYTISGGDSYNTFGWKGDLEKFDV